MKGHKFLKVTGILMIIAAVFSIIGGVFVGGFGALGSLLGGGLGFSYWLVLLLTLGGGICQMIAGIKGVKHSKRAENAKNLIIWGAIVAAFALLTIITNLAGGAEFSFMNVVTGLIVPALYIYGAVLNSKADDTQAAA